MDQISLNEVVSYADGELAPKMCANSFESRTLASVLERAVRENPCGADVRHTLCAMSISRFNPNWKDEFLFIHEGGQSVVCLVCGRTLRNLRRYNLARHYATLHSGFEDSHPRGSLLRQEYLERQMAGYVNTHVAESFVSVEDRERAITLSYQLALLLAKKMKALSDSDGILESAFELLAEQIEDPDTVDLLHKIPLSRQTMTRRTEVLAQNVARQISQFVARCTVFSLVLDDSTDIGGVPQLAIFVRAVTNDFIVEEELLGLEALHGRTTGENLFNALIHCTEANALDFSKLECVCRDGAQSFVGCNAGCLALFERHVGRPVLKYHCLLHQEALVGKTLNLKPVMDVVVRCVNAIRARDLTRREFRAFLQELQSQYTELLLYTEIRWLSRGQVLVRFCQLREHILCFLNEHNLLPADRPLLNDPEWLADLGFLTDIVGHLNDLNIQLQGGQQLFHRLFGLVTAFPRKLRLFRIQLEQGRYDSFPHLREFASHIEHFDMSKYTNLLIQLLDAFEERFRGLETEELNVRLFINPFLVSDAAISVLPAALAMDVLELQSTIQLRIFFESFGPLPSEEELLQFWKILPIASFPHLRAFAQRMVCRFGTVFRCEQTFSLMKIIKGKYRARLTDDHLAALLRLATTEFAPDIPALTSHWYSRN